MNFKLQSSLHNIPLYLFTNLLKRTTPLKTSALPLIAYVKMVRRVFGCFFILKQYHIQLVLNWNLRASLTWDVSNLPIQQGLCFCRSWLNRSGFKAHRVCLQCKQTSLSLSLSLQEMFQVWSQLCVSTARFIRLYNRISCAVIEGIPQFACVYILWRNVTEKDQ